MNSTTVKSELLKTTKVIAGNQIIASGDQMFQQLTPENKRIVNQRIALLAALQSNHQ